MKTYILITFFIASLFVISCEDQVADPNAINAEVIKELADPSSPKLKKIAIKTNTMYECGHNNKAIGISWMSMNYTYTKKSKYILREKEDTTVGSNACELNTFNKESKEVHFKKQQHKTDSYHCRAFFIKRFIEDKCIEAKLKKKYTRKKRLK